MDCSSPGFPALHYLSEFAETHVHWFGNAIQRSRSLSPPSPPALSLSQYLSQSFPVSRLVESGGQSIGASASAWVLPVNTQGWFPLDWLVWSPCCPRDSQESSLAPHKFLSYRSLNVCVHYTILSVVPYQTEFLKPVIIRLKPSGAPVALEKKSNLLESKGLLHLAPPSAWPLISATRPLSGQPSTPLVLGPGELSRFVHTAPMESRTHSAPFSVSVWTPPFWAWPKYFLPVPHFVTFYLSQGRQIGSIICARPWRVKMRSPESFSLLRGNGFCEPRWLLPKVQGGEATGCLFHSFHPYL